MKKGLPIFYWLILLFYLILLINTVFISRDSLRSIQFIPFHSIREFIMIDNGFGHYRLVDMNIWGNILMFVPAGIYVILHNKNKSILHNILLIFLMSLAIEIIQFIFALGATDIDDIILNVAGGLIGLIIYQVLKKIYKTEEKVKNAVALLSLIAGVPILALTLLLLVAN